MLSTAHNTSDEVAMKRFKESRDKQPLPCPSCVSDYNCYVYMGGVELADQYISYYSLTLRRL